MVFDDPRDVQIDTAAISLYESFYGYTFPLSAPGNIAPFFTDTNGQDAACAASETSRAADSTCSWGYVNSRRIRRFSKPGTYIYHTLFGNGGKIIVH